MTPEQRGPLYLVAAVAAISFLATTSRNRQNCDRFIYRGFAIDTSLVGSCPALLESLRYQIDVVADSGVDPEILDFFRRQRIAINPRLGSQLGHFTSHNGIELSPDVSVIYKPVLLHELLHAFHCFCLPRGFENFGVLEFYRRAGDFRSHPMNCYAMSNAAEFFAVTATAYLFGSEGRPPYNRENLEWLQPNYCAWLEEMFGI